MVTATLPAIPQVNTALDQLIAGAAAGAGGTKQTQTVDNGLLDVLRSLTSGLGGSDFSKNAAITDISGVVSTLARQALEQTRPSEAAGARGAGLRSSSTQQLIRNDADARIQGELAKVIQANIASYGQLQQGQVNAAANATGASRQTNAQSSSDALRAALTQAGIGLGGQVAKELGVKAIGGIKDIFGFTDSGSATTSLGSAFQNSNPSLPFNLGGGTAAAGGLGSGTFDFGELGSGVSDFFTGSGSGSLSDIFGGASDVVSGIGTDVVSGVSDAVSGAGSFFGDIGSSISDFFGGLFEDGGRIPVVSGDKKIPLGKGGMYGAMMVPPGFEGGGKVPAKPAAAQDPQAALKAFMQAVQDPLGNPGRTVQARATEVSAEAPMLQSLFQAIGLLPAPAAAPAATGKEDGGVIDGKPAPHVGDNKQAKVNGTPVGLRGGEYIIPTDVVDLIGEGVFDELVAAYHTPRNKGAAK